MALSQQEKRPSPEVVHVAQADHHSNLPRTGTSTYRFIPHPTYDGVSPIVYETSPAHVRARELLAWATEVYGQAQVDLHHLRMLNQWRTQSPIVSRISEMAAGWQETEEDRPLYLPPNAYLARACSEFRDAVSALQSATEVHREADVIKLTNKAVLKLRSAAGTWHEQHQRISDYQQRTGQGNLVVQASVKTAYLAIVAATTGFTVGGALGIGSGTLRSLALTSSATGAATGTTTAALTAAEQLHAGTFDATAIAHSGLRETARTLTMGIIAGGLARAFAAALSPVVYSLAKYSTQKEALSASRAAMVHHDALVNSVIAALAGGGAGALTAAIEGVLAAQVGHPLSEAEFSKLVVEQLVISGAYQTALAVAVRRTNSRFVDLRDKPIEEVLAGKHTPPPGHWGLYEVSGPERTVNVLAQPRYLDYNGAIYDKKGLSKEVEAVHRALNNPTTTDNYVPNSLLIHTHGFVDRLDPGNKNVAHLTNRVLALPGMQNIDSVGLRACSQVDARWPGNLSNAQVFEAELQQALSANNSPRRPPPVYTGSKPGETSAGQFTRDTTRLAGQGGIRTDNWFEYELERINDRALRKYYLFYATGGAATLMTLRPHIARSVLDWIGIGGPGGATSDQEPLDSAPDGDSPTGDMYSDLPRAVSDEHSDRARQ